MMTPHLCMMLWCALLCCAVLWCAVAAGLNVVPAPYITVQQTISKVLGNKTLLAPQLLLLDEVQTNDLRLLGYYFPARLNLCSRQEDVQALLLDGCVRLSFFLVVSAVAVWHVSMTHTHTHTERERERERETRLMCVFSVCVCVCHSKRQ